MKLVEKISPTFGCINMEMIKSSDCYMVEEYLKKNASCPVFHNCQHGTAIAL